MGSAREVLLVGSVPLRPAAAVFECVARNLGALVPRIPDGEQIGWVRAVFQSHERNAALESKRKVPLDSGGRFPTSVYSLKPGKTADDLELGPYGYADNAIPSYQQFRKLREAGTVPQGTRFQATMPGPGTSVFVIEMPAERILPKARQALLEEIERITQAIPAADLTIQLDVAMEAEHEEYLRRPEAWDQPMHTVFHWTLPQMADSVAWLANRIPKGVELGFHICSIWHHDTGAGQDNQVLVDVANALIERIERPVGYVHIPVIPEHTDKDYAVLQQLALPPGTKLYLGLLNLSDGLEGAKKRIAMASRYVEDFGIAMFCGLGRAPGTWVGGPSDSNVQQKVLPILRRATPDTIDDVLKLHREAASL
jgi:hypothetical protein